MGHYGNYNINATLGAVYYIMERLNKFNQSMINHHVIQQQSTYSRATQPASYR